MAQHLDSFFHLPITLQVREQVPRIACDCGHATEPDAATDDTQAYNAPNLTPISTVEGIIEDLANGVALGIVSWIQNGYWVCSGEYGAQQIGETENSSSCYRTQDAISSVSVRGFGLFGLHTSQSDP